MPDWCRLTDHVVLFTVVVLVLYNVAAGVFGGGNATISARMQLHGYRFPIIPIVLGALLAHWFWPVFGGNR